MSVETLERQKELGNSQRYKYQGQLSREGKIDVWSGTDRQAKSSSENARKSRTQTSVSDKMLGNVDKQVKKGEFGRVRKKAEPMMNATDLSRRMSSERRKGSRTRAESKNVPEHATEGVL
jgi:hypothetical protein